MDVLRYTAFSDQVTGGNPAGVVLDARSLDEQAMLRIATDVGFSETAFLLPREDSAETFDMRYFSPRAEVPFCGHATVATAIAYAERHGPGTMRLHTPAGEVVVTSRTDGDGLEATLTSVPPRTKPMPDALADRLLAALRWERSELDPALPLAVAFGGAWHPVVATGSRERLARLDYDYAALDALTAEQDWTTVDLVWRESEIVFYARNPFPTGGVVEDPATGAAAAAFGGYLREHDLVGLPADLLVHQGDDLGRPSLLRVHVPVSREAGIGVSGTARVLPDGAP